MGEVLIVGDTNLLADAGPTGSLRHVAESLSSADAVVGQMEGLIVADAEIGPDPLPYKPGWRHSPPGAACAYASVFSAVSCASNVAYPPEACAETAQRLAAAGLPFTGIGSTETSAREPAILDLAAARIGLLSYTSVFQPGLLAAGPDRPGCAVLPAHTAYRPGRRALEMPGAPPEVHSWPDDAAFETLATDIAALRGQVDIVLVSCHWGLSGATEPVSYQVALARAAAAAGADLVFGHHPHVVQGAARVAGMPVFYSLGNFAFDNPRMIGRHLDGVALRVSLRRRRIAGITVMPVQRDKENAVRFLSGVEPAGRDILESFASRSAALGQATRAVPEGLWLE